MNGFWPIVTTSSMKHELFLKSIGATHVLDRTLSSESILARLRELTEETPVVYAFDAISDKDTEPMAYDALAQGGVLVVTIPFETFWESRVQPGDGKRVARPIANLTLPENADVGLKLYEHISEWLRVGDVVVSHN